jgi:pimeloyl-ACP methyl ester carboxylesterase
LAVAGISGVVDLVEAMHHHIAIIPRILAKPERDRTTGITRLVYRSIRGVVKLVGDGLDALLERLAPLLDERGTWPGRESLLAALNGVLGDYLEASSNPLAITPSLRRNGIALPRKRASLAAAIPGANGKLVVLVHGLCMNDLQWTRKRHDHGAALARDLGYTPLYLHYNSGLHVCANGRAFAAQLESIVRDWPVTLTELVLIGHSMGGLVVRSACHYGAQAGHAWLSRLDAIVFLGTPHHGAPLERIGNGVDVLLGASRYSAPLARLGRIRSAGITDLRFGNLVDEDGSESDRFARKGDRRIAVPLPEGVACYTIAATLAKSKDVRGGGRIGDGLVPLASALGRHANPQLALRFDASRQHVVRRTGHLDLLSSRRAYAQIRRWLAAPHGRLAGTV